MRRYVIRRLLQGIVLLFFISILVFVLLHLIPGGPVQGLAPHLTAEERANLIHQYGLDQPLYVQYLKWLQHLLHGDLGTSISTQQSVASVISSRLPATLELFLTALGFSLITALLAGVISAVKQYSLTDYSVTFLAYLGIAMPNFWFALILQQAFGVHLHLLPIFGIASSNTTGFSPLDNFQDRAIHVILPALVLSVQIVASWSRYLRSSMLDTIKQDYVRTARAKGMSSWVIFFRHALRNALLPFITVVALDFAGIASGAVVTEALFAWPGLGNLFVDSLNSRDYPVLLSMLLIAAIAVIAFNLIADILYAVVDPRIRYS